MLGEPGMGPNVVQEPFVRPGPNRSNGGVSGSWPGSCTYLQQIPFHAPWSQKRFGLIIIVVVVPMTVMAPVPVSIRIIVVIILAIVMRIIAPVIYRIRGAISGSDRYTEITVSLRFWRHESHEPKR
jgi:hypothetical protein